ncbi:MAG: hypothetical protein E7517_00110 [Ruminococcaceae bacterium]|nr:hypothetical protein [Oscillospiraceae bacterium]
MSCPGRDIICIDGEISYLTKDIIKYIDGLCDGIRAYNHSIDMVQSFGVQDELIRSKLSNLSEILNAYKQKLNEISDSISKEGNGYLKDFAENDKFTFPGHEIDAIESIINMFS